MTAIARNIAANGDCTCSGGEVLVVDLGFRQGADTELLEPLDGRQFAVTLYRTSDREELFSYAGEIGPDGEMGRVRFVVPGEATAAILDTEDGSASWQIVEIVEDGLKFWLKGHFTVTPAAASVTPAPPGSAEPPATRITFDAATKRVLIVPTGAPGRDGADGTDITAIDDEVIAADRTFSSARIAGLAGVTIPFTGTSSTGSINPRDTLVVGTLGYQPDFGAGTLKIFDISADPPALLSTSTPPYPFFELRGVAVMGGWTFVTVQGSQASPGAAVDVWDTRDPSAPAFVARKTSANLLNPAFCRVAGRYLLVLDIRIGGGAGTLNGRIVAFDATDPANLVERGRWEVPDSGKCARFDMEGLHAFVPVQSAIAPSPSDALHIVDFSDPDAPVSIGSVALPDATYGADCAQANGYAYVPSEGLGGFSVVDVRDRAAPALVASVRLPALADPPALPDPLTYAPESTSLSIAGTTLYVPDMLASIMYAYDVSDPAGIPDPIAVTQSGLDTPARMAAQGNFVFPSNRGIGGTAGIGKLRTSDVRFRAAEIGAARIGHLRADGAASAAGLHIDGNGHAGGHFWIGGDMGVRGDLRVGGMVAPATFMAPTLQSPSFTGTDSGATLVRSGSGTFGGAVIGNCATNVPGIQSIGDGQAAVVQSVSYAQTPPAASGQLALDRSRGTRAAPAIVGATDGIGSIRFRAWQGSAWTRVGEIQVAMSEFTPSPTALGTRMSFAVVPQGTAGSTEVLRLEGTLVTAYVPLALPADPASPLHAAPKQYVDNTVSAAISNLVASAPGALDTLNELAAALGNDANFATTVTNALAAKAPLASPALTGAPTAPTAAPGTSTTQLATTAFVGAAITAAGVPVPFATKAEATAASIAGQLATGTPVAVANDETCGHDPVLYTQTNVIAVSTAGYLAFERLLAGDGQW